MHRVFLKIFVITVLLSAAAYGQEPLGDIARQYREKKEAEQAASTPAKVLTNQDLGKDPNAAAQPPAAQKAARPPGKTADDHPAQQTLAEEREAQHWKAQILEQKGKIAFLQAQIDQANDNIRSTYGSAATAGPFTRPLVQAQQRVAQMQLQLEDMKRKLEETQDAARHAGMHSAVYDP